MLKEILEQRGLSVYKLSQDTGISYSTLNDIVIEKTDIKNTSAKQRLIDEAILISDSIAILTYDNPDIPDDCVEAVCLARPNSKAVIRLKDYAIILSSMSKAMQNRAIEAVKRNIEEIEEVRKYSDTGYYKN